jgi:hypothetical protein
MQKFQTPAIQAAFGLLFSVIFGFLLSLLPAAILRKSEE